MKGVLSIAHVCSLEERARNTRDHSEQTLITDYSLMKAIPVVKPKDRGNRGLEL